MINVFGPDQQFIAHAVWKLYRLHLLERIMMHLWCFVAVAIYRYIPQNIFSGHNLSSSQSTLSCCVSSLDICEYTRLFEKMYFFVHIFHLKHFICSVFHCCSLRCNSCNAIVSALQQKVSFKRFPLLKRSVLPGVKHNHGRDGKVRNIEKTFNWLNCL